MPSSPRDRSAPKPSSGAVSSLAIQGGHTESSSPPSPPRRPLSPTHAPAVSMTLQPFANESCGQEKQRNVFKGHGLQSKASDEENNKECPILLASNPAEKSGLQRSPAANGNHTDAKTQNETLDIDQTVEPEVLMALSTYIDTLRVDDRGPTNNKRRKQQRKRKDKPDGDPYRERIKTISESASWNETDISPDMLSLVRQYIERLPQESVRPNDSEHLDIDPATQAFLEEYVENLDTRQKMKKNTNEADVSNVKPKKDAVGVAVDAEISDRGEAYLSLSPGDTMRPKNEDTISPNAAPVLMNQSPSIPIAECSFEGMPKEVIQSADNHPLVGSISDPMEYPRGTEEAAPVVHSGQTCEPCDSTSTPHGIEISVPTEEVFNDKHLVEPSLANAAQTCEPRDSTYSPNGNEISLPTQEVSKDQHLVEPSLANIGRPGEANTSAVSVKGTATKGETQFDRQTGKASTHDIFTTNLPVSLTQEHSMEVDKQSVAIESLQHVHHTESSDLQAVNSSTSDRVASRMYNLLNAIQEWAEDGSSIDHPLLTAVALDSEMLETLETFVDEAGRYSVEQQDILQEPTIPEEVVLNVKSFLQAIHGHNAGKLMRFKIDPPTTDDEAAVGLEKTEHVVDSQAPFSKVSPVYQIDKAQHQETRDEEEKKNEEEDVSHSDTTGDVDGSHSDTAGRAEGTDTPWWEATAKLAVTSMEDAPWIQATAMLAVTSLDAFRGDKHSDGVSQRQSAEEEEEETMDDATYSTRRDDSDTLPSKGDGGVTDDIDAFWKAQRALRERRMQNQKEKEKTHGVALPDLNVASYSYNSHNTTQSGRSENSANTGSFSKASTETFDTMDERWLLKRSMADYTPWGKPQWPGSKKATLLEVDDPEPINGVQASRSIRKLSRRWKERRDSIFSAGWILSYEERCARHRGYQGVDIYSMMDGSNVSNKNTHRLDNRPWEKRDVKQYFLYEHSITARNWFGRFKRYSTVKIDLPVCRPRSMEMPVKAPEWTEDWYRTPYLRSLGTNISGSVDGEAQDYYRKYVQSDDDFEEEDDWEDTPECGTLKNTFLKPGEHISRVTPELTSSLRRSRWRKKFFPKGTFPY